MQLKQVFVQIQERKRNKEGGKERKETLQPLPHELAYLTFTSRPVY
jgi:hypothetical protein